MYKSAGWVDNVKAFFSGGQPQAQRPAAPPPPPIDPEKAARRARVRANIEGTKKGKGLSNASKTTYTLEELKAARAYAKEQAGKKQRVIGRTGGDNLSPWYKRPGEGIMRHGNRMGTRGAFNGGILGGAQRGYGAVVGNKYVAHGALPTALAAGAGAGAYYYNKRRKSKSAALEAELFNEALLNINFETALLDEIEAWKEANYYGY